MNALDILRSDHQRIRDLFVALREADSVAEKRDLYETIRDELERHTELEEEGFYPAFQDGFGDDIADIVSDALEDHQEMRDILNDIEDAGDDEDLVDLMEELMDLVDSHIQDEESVLFDELLETVEESQLEAIGQRLQELKKSTPRAA